MLLARWSFNRLTLLLFLVICASQSFSQNSATAESRRQNKDAIASLIERLREIGEGGMGYTPTMTGSGFLPLGIDAAGAFLLGQVPPANSGNMRELVERGAAAVPHLIANLNDARPTRITVREMGMGGGLIFNDEYDYNSRTAVQPPPGVNRDREAGQDHPHTHTVTVGDLCFVALGQIVNRHFSAVRYQPTFCIMVNSPTYSEALRKAIEKEWGNLTPDQHRERLVRDFREPDSEDRLIGACLRLGYYYPETLEPLALKQLAERRYDVFKVENLIRKKLYRAKDATQRKGLFDAFIAKHGEVARQGILVDLFGDLQIQEADEERRLSPPLKEKYAARACLVELYRYPKEVKSQDKPNLLPVEDAMQARFIDAISFFPSAKIDQAVREILHSTECDYLASSCARYLVGRGADADIERYVKQYLKGADAARREELDRMRDRLGWTPLHVAAEVYEQSDRIPDLLLKGADVNARAANGQTPLHVAADHGSYGAIRLLLAGKANPNLKDRQGRTPVQLGIPYDSAVEMLLAAGAEPSDIFVASFAGRADVVERFLKEDKSLVGARTLSGETALHFAARRGYVSVAKVLLAQGADVNAMDNERNKLRPIHLAASYAGAEMVALLLAHKADPNAKSWDGRSAFSHAWDSNNQRVIRLLKEQK